MPFRFNTSCPTAPSSSSSSSSTATPTANFASSSSIPPHALPPPPFALGQPPPRTQNRATSGPPSSLSHSARDSPSSSCSSGASSEVEDDGFEGGAGSGGVSSAGGGSRGEKRGTSSAASSWHSLLDNHNHKSNGSSETGSTGGEEETPRGELPPNGRGGELNEATTSNTGPPSPSYFPPSPAFPPPVPTYQPLYHSQSVSPHTTSPPPPSSFRSPNIPHHYATPSISTTLSANSTQSTNSTSRSSVFSVTSVSSQSSASSGGSSSSCSVSTPILPQPWPTADLSLGGGPGQMDITDEDALIVETSEEMYTVIAYLPGFILDCITIATKQRRTLHIVADRWEGGSGVHFERKVTFGPDANLLKIRAQFDGNHLRLEVPRHPVDPNAAADAMNPISSNATKLNRSSAPSRASSYPPSQDSLSEDHRRSGAVLESGYAGGYPETRSKSLGGGVEGLEKLGLGATREQIEREVERARVRELSDAGGRFAF